MYEIRDNQVVRVTEGIQPITSKQISSDIDALNKTIEDFKKQIDLLTIDLEIVRKLEAELK